MTEEQYQQEQQDQELAEQEANQQAAHADFLRDELMGWQQQLQHRIKLPKDMTKTTLQRIIDFFKQEGEVNSDNYLIQKTCMGVVHVLSQELDSEQDQIEAAYKEGQFQNDRSSMTAQQYYQETYGQKA